MCFSFIFFSGIWWLKLKNGNWARSKYPVLAPSLTKATPVVMAIPQVLLEDNKCAPAETGTITLYDLIKQHKRFQTKEGVFLRGRRDDEELEQNFF